MLRYKICAFTLGLILLQTTTSFCAPIKILVCAPHPDDDIIGCGGSIAKHVKNGNEVFVVYMTSGEKATSSPHPESELAQVREQEAKAAAHLLGVKTTYFLRNPDRALKPTDALILKLINIIRTIKPTIVYIPHKQDAHKDHAITHEIVMLVLKLAALEKNYTASTPPPWTVETVLGYEVWTPLSRPSHTEDISDFISLKLRALRLHATQIKSLKYDGAIEGLNRYRGITRKHGTHAECFYVYKSPNHNNGCSLNPIN